MSLKDKLLNKIDDDETILDQHIRTFALMIQNTFCSEVERDSNELHNKIMDNRDKPLNGFSSKEEMDIMLKYSKDMNLYMQDVRHNVPVKGTELLAYLNGLQADYHENIFEVARREINDKFPDNNMSRLKKSSRKNGSKAKHSKKRSRKQSRNSSRKSSRKLSRRRRSRK
jgi:hypothetical protein